MRSSREEPRPKTQKEEVVRRPLCPALQQCNNLILLQDALLQNALKHRNEIIDRNSLGRKEYEEVCEKLQV